MFPKFRAFTISALLSILVFSSCRNQTPATDPAILTRLAGDIGILASDSLLGRAPCTTGETRTIHYLEKRMREIGLEPAFGQQFLQEVPLVKITSLVPGLIDLQTAGGKLSFTTGSDITVWSPIKAEEINLKNSDLVFAGFGIDAPERKWNDFAGIDVRGKTILVMVNDPGFYTGDTALFRGKAMTYYGRWRYKFEEAERKGAAGCLIIHRDDAAGYPWSVVNRHHNHAEYYLDDQKLADVKCKLQGWLTYAAAQKLFAVCGRNLDEWIRKASSPGFKAGPMHASLSYKAVNRFEKCTSHNVGGLLRGIGRPDEVVVYTAHWDHLGTGVPVNGDSIYNGASDNAAAMAWMLAIAGKFKNAKNVCKRSLLFLAPTAEESGLYGSEWYVKNPVFALDKTVACLNSDVYLFLGHFKDVTVTGLGHSELDEILKTEAANLDRYIAADPNPENGMLFRSDQLPFMKAGVPALFAKGYSDQADLGKTRTLARINDYWKNIYHKPSDEFNPAADKLEGLSDDAELFFRVGQTLANAEKFPKWYRSSEFYIKK